MACIDKICSLCDTEYRVNNGTIIRECQKCFQDKPLNGFKLSDTLIKYEYITNSKIRTGKHFWYWGSNGTPEKFYLEEDEIQYHSCQTWNVYHKDNYLGYWKCKHSMKKNLRKMGVKIHV